MNESLDTLYHICQNCGGAKDENEEYYCDECVESLTDDQGINYTLNEGQMNFILSFLKDYQGYNEMRDIMVAEFEKRLNR